MSTGDDPSFDPTPALRPSVPPPAEPPAALLPEDPDPAVTDPAVTVSAVTVSAVTDPAGRRRPGVPMGGFLLVAAAVLEVLALVPAEAPGYSSLGHVASNAAPPIVLGVGLLLAAVLLGVPGRRAAPAGAAIAAGLVLADLGLLVAELGVVLAGTSLGAGDGLLIAAWAVAAIGTMVALAGQRGGRLGRVGRPRRRDNAQLTFFTLIAGVVLGVSLLPAWVRFHLTYTGGSQTVLTGSVFAVHTPVLVLVGDLAAAVVFAAVPLCAVLWRPGRIGAMATVGVVIVVAGQTLSAVLQASETRLSQFVRTLAQARADDLSVRTSLTGWFDAEVIAIVALLLLVVARWWTPAGGSLLDSYPVGGGRAQGGGHRDLTPAGGSGWGPPLTGSTARPEPGHIGHGGPFAPPSASPPPGAWPGAGAGAPHGTTAGHH